MQCVAVCCSVLQCVAVCCSAFAIWYTSSTRSRASIACWVWWKWFVMQWVAVCCVALQCVAVCCSVLQHTATWCTSSTRSRASIACWVLRKLSARSPTLLVVCRVHSADISDSLPPYWCISNIHMSLILWFSCFTWNSYVYQIFICLDFESNTGEYTSVMYLIYIWIFDVYQIFICPDFVIVLFHVYIYITNHKYVCGESCGFVARRGESCGFVARRHLSFASFFCGMRTNGPYVTKRDQSCGFVARRHLSFAVGESCHVTYET